MRLPPATAALAVALALLQLCHCFQPSPGPLAAGLRGGRAASMSKRPLVAPSPGALRSRSGAEVSFGSRRVGRSGVSLAMNMDTAPPAPAVQADRQVWGSAVAVGFKTISEGLEDAAERCKKQLGGAKPDVAFVFISSRYLEGRGGAQPASKSDLKAIIPKVQSLLGVRHVIGCTASGVLGTSEEDGSPEEFEDFKGVSLSAARLPNVSIQPFRLNAKDLPDAMEGKQEEWRTKVKGPPEADKPSFVVLSGQAFSATGELNKLISGLDYAYSSAVKVGGISSGMVPGGVFCSDFEGGCVDSDAVGLCLSGDIEIQPIVAQGCRPVGGLFEVVESKGNQVTMVMEIGKGKDSTPCTPMAALKEVLQGLDEKDVTLAQSALLLGIASNSFKTVTPQEDLGPGDFLIRQVVGVVVKDGAFVIGDLIKPGQRFRFHLRDKEAAVAEAEALFSTYKRSRLEAMMTGKPSNGASGVVMFACNGRGRSLYNEENYDSRMAYLSTGVPVVGMFCNGEIGPIGSETHLHGFTSVFAVFRQASAAKPSAPAPEES